jgi:hypothetical protein
VIDPLWLLGVLLAGIGVFMTIALQDWNHRPSRRLPGVAAYFLIVAGAILFVVGITR